MGVLRKLIADAVDSGSLTDMYVMLAFTATVWTTSQQRAEYLFPHFRCCLICVACVQTIAINRMFVDAFFFLQNVDVDCS